MLKIINSFLELNLANQILNEYKDKDGCDRTNRTHWDQDIKGDSTTVLVNDIDSRFMASLAKRVNEEFNTKNIGFSAMFYRWSPLSYIPPHLDYDITYAVTIHLNRNYNPKNGGMFLYKKHPEDPCWIGVEPMFNRAVLADTSDGIDIWHQVTPVTSRFDRLSIQMFGN